MPVLTRRAARVQKCILTVLPNEVTTEIILFCNSSSRARLCRVSKLFKQLAHRRLYEIVKLDDSSPSDDNKIAQFHALLDANPQYASWVKDLSLASLTREITDHIDAILGKTTELWRLSLATRQLNFAWTFPKLRVFCEMQHSVNLASRTPFLKRHPTLVQVSLRAVSAEAFITPVDLPNLVKYEGHWNSLEVLGNAEKLCFVNLKILNSKALDAFARFPTCLHVCIEGARGEEDARVILQSLKRHLPHLKSLVLADTLILRPNPRLTSILDEELTGFKHLESFGIVLSLSCYGSQKFCRSTMDSCLRSCPTLREFLWRSVGSKPRRYGYKVINGTVQPMVEKSRLDDLLDFSY
ncbi:hypothetical protein C8J56DRAFT_1026138 [Mycena floridula]|nr:hypothetical protein C8J56DRAFT_1026138 [Mycena floridula]